MRVEFNPCIFSRIWQTLINSVVVVILIKAVTAWVEISFTKNKSVNRINFTFFTLPSMTVPFPVSE